MNHLVESKLLNDSNKLILSNPHAKLLYSQLNFLVNYTFRSMFNCNDAHSKQRFHRHMLGIYELRNIKQSIIKLTPNYKELIKSKEFNSESIQLSLYSSVNKTSELASEAIVLVKSWLSIKPSLLPYLVMAKVSTIDDVVHYRNGDGTFELTLLLSVYNALNTPSIQTHIKEYL